MADYDDSYDMNGDMDDIDQVSEHDLLIEALNSVEMEINRYADVVEYLWNEKVKPFIESNDCSILEQIYCSDHRKFYEMMYSQPIYIELIDSCKKIRNKLDILNKLANM